MPPIRLVIITLKRTPKYQMLYYYVGLTSGGVIGPTQRPCVYLLVEGTTWSPRNRSMKGILKELFNILSFFKIQICVHILLCVYHIFIVMINQMAKSFVDMSKIKIENVIPKLFVHSIHLFTLLKWYWLYKTSQA